MNNLGLIIRIKRVSKRIKQKDLAKRIGTTSHYLCLIEYGKREPSLKVLRRISEELNCSIKEFFD